MFNYKIIRENFYFKALLALSSVNVSSNVKDGVTKLAKFNENLLK